MLISSVKKGSRQRLKLLVLVDKNNTGVVSAAVLMRETLWVSEMPLGSDRQWFSARCVQGCCLGGNTAQCVQGMGFGVFGVDFFWHVSVSKVPVLGRKRVSVFL